jgi:uncharacterized membrane protein YciS (DUF1049 family)
MGVKKHSANGYSDLTCLIFQLGLVLQKLLYGRIYVAFHKSAAAKEEWRQAKKQKKKNGGVALSKARQGRRSLRSPVLTRLISRGKN